LLYTDGITEAQNPKGEFFGTERLARLLATQSPNAPQEIINKIVTELRSFSEGASFDDDVSMVVLKAV
jgi:sigma-B regulation protein RsbU (phosphoserine phosphatase)